MSDVLVAQLRVLVEGDDRAMARVLHPRVVLRRLDASEVHGREAVLAALAPRDDTHHRVLEAAGDSLRVELTAEGVPGALHFGLRGRALSGRLIEVSVTAD
ncbi:MAG: hypothetical protein U0325_26315 [Polyangiales bacterium]